MLKSGQSDSTHDDTMAVSFLLCDILVRQLNLKLGDAIQLVKPLDLGNGYLEGGKQLFLSTITPCKANIAGKVPSGVMKL